MSDSAATAQAPRADERSHNEKLGAWLGEIVHWYPDRNRNQDPTPAMVSGVNADTLHLHLFAQNTYTMPIRDGVRHIDDQRASPHEVHDSGVWDFTPARKGLNEALRKLNQLYNQQAQKK